MKNLPCLTSKVNDTMPETLMHQVFDTAMEPEYKTGCRVVCRNIPFGAPFFEYGETYLLITCNGNLLRSIRKSDREGFVLCHASSSDPSWQPFYIPLRDDVIYGIYKVVLMCNAV